MNHRIVFFASLLLGLCLIARVAMAADLPKAEVRALIEKQAHAWETGDEAAFLTTLHEDAVFAYPGKRLNKTGALEVFRQWKKDFRDTAMPVHRLVIDGANFAIEYTFATTNVATGKRTAAGTVAIGEVRDGKLYAWKEYLDGRVSRAQAKGELPVDEKAEPFPWPDTPESRKP